MTATDPSGSSEAVSPAATPAIRLSELTVSYGPIRSLDGVDLTVEAGERVALVGPSGAGKSSLLNVVAGLVDPTAGTVEVLGVQPDLLRGRALRRHRARVGLVGQQLQLALPLRVVHNVNAGALGRWSTARALWSLARPTGRADVAETLTAVGLEDRIDARTDELSGGERQRVAVARVLRHRPELILADEPTSSVDPALSDQVMALLSPPDGADRQTVVVSVHDPELARRHTDRTIGLREGRVLFDLPSETVDDDALAELYHGR